MNPFGFIWMAASQSEAAKEFFCGHLGANVNRIAFYCDEVTPGNVLRPDHGRSFEVVYWSFLELPRWFRSNASASWFPLLFVESKKLHDVEGGMSAVAKAVVHLFFPAGTESFNFESTGMLIGDVHVRAKFGCWLADERAIKSVLSCKGASGHKPCVTCKNVVTRMDRADPYLVHFACSDESKFDKHSAESFAAMVRDLKAKEGATTKAEFDFLEKAYGLVFQKNALVFDDHCLAITKFPTTVYWDWMHCMFASGGVAQYNVNAFLLEIVRVGLPLADIDEFAAKITTPSSKQKLTRTFFQDRTVLRDGAHIKAFASEMITAIQVLGIFSDVVLLPMGVLGSHIKCFDLLRELSGTLVMGDVVATMLGRAREVMQNHHEKLAELYPLVVKPKIHYLKHSFDSIERLGVNLSCFGPERRHKDAKRIAEFAFRDVCKTMLVRMTNSMLQTMATASTFKRCELGKPTSIPDWCKVLLQRSGCAGAECSNELHVRDCGVLKGGDVVWLRNPYRLAKVRLAIANRNEAFVVVDLLAKHPTGEWSANVASTTVVTPEEVMTTCCHMVVDGKVFV